MVKSSNDRNNYISFSANLCPNIRHKCTTGLYVFQELNINRHQGRIQPKEQKNKQTPNRIKRGIEGSVLFDWKWSCEHPTAINFWFYLLTPVFIFLFLILSK